jgi:hypothetical protein
MNERIESLMKQAGGEFYEGFAGSPNSIKFTEEEFEKFAELIVRECAKLVEDNIDPQNAWITTAHIKQHFGVKE